MNETNLIQHADELMRSEKPAEALKIYQSAWEQSRTDLNKKQQVWLLLSIANAAIRKGDHTEALNALAALQERYADTGIVVGNPLFHLLAGFSLHGLNENPEGQTDNFARALICGGPEIFAGENPIHLVKMKKILKPPAELGTWTGYTGSSLHLLNGASGYLRDLLIEKLGQTPPYKYE